MGLDSRELTPGLVDRIVCLSAETRSYHRAEAETQALSVAAPRAVEPTNESPAEEDSPPDTGVLTTKDWRPKRLVRTVVASVRGSREFGRQMSREAKRRRFFEAVARAFLGDGLAWNWSIHREQFPSFTPILDFIHPLSYLFLAAKAVHPSSDDDAWSQYAAWMRGCWRGEVGQIIDELQAWQMKLGPPPKPCPSTDVREIVIDALTYLTNNQERMNYPAYRQAGLPVTTAWMESLVKEMNYRVKGTEMFWNDPDGGEAILQVRAASLSDDDRLSRHVRHRPGRAFTRRPKRPKLKPSRQRRARKS